jgi:hypothetical protein
MPHLPLCFLLTAVIISVIAAVLVARDQSLSFSGGLSRISLGVLGLTSCGLVGMAFFSLWELKRLPRTMRAFVGISDVGGLMLALVAAALSQSLAPGLTLVSVIVVIGSLMLFAFIVRLPQGQASFVTTKAALDFPLSATSSALEVDTAAPPKEPEVDASSAMSEDSVPVIAAPPSPAVVPSSSTLPFIDDPLFAIPQPKRARFFFTTKDDGPSIYCEDACAISPDETRFALCDGTSQSKLPRPWATLLAQKWIEEPLEAGVSVEALNRWLEQPRRDWCTWVRETWVPTISQRDQAVGLPGVTEEQYTKIMERRAASTFLGVTLRGRTGGAGVEWQALALGDTCLFALRRDGSHWRLSAPGFPLSSSKDFANPAPHSFPCREVDASLLVPHVRFMRGTCLPGDILLLATDALAEWVLRQMEHRSEVWETCITLEKQTDFDLFVNFYRNEEQSREFLRNDDTTLVLIPI